MSGPKCISYSVEHLAAVRASALAQLRDESQRLSRRAAGLARALADARVDGIAGVPAEVSSDLPDTEDPARLDEAVARLRTELQRSEAELAAARLRHRCRASLSALTSDVAPARAWSAADALAGAADGRVDAEAVGAGAGGSRSEAAAARVDRLVALLPMGTPPVTFDGVARAAERALRTGARQHMEQLGLLVDRAPTAVASAARARALLDAAVGVPGLDGLRGDLARVEDGEPPPSSAVWEAWEAQVARSRDETDRDYALRAASEALADLGYELGPDFDTSLHGGGSAAFTRPGWDGYAVRVRSGGNSLNVNVVRDVDAEDRDIAVETAWCDDVADLRDALSDAGVSTTVTRAEPAGAAPVQQVAAVPRPTRAAAASDERRRRPRHKAEERPL